MGRYETEGFWLKKLVSGYFVSEKQIKFYPHPGTRTKGRW